MVGNLLIRQRPGIDCGTVAFHDLRTIAASNNREARYDLMRAAKEFSGDPFGISGIRGFADDPAVAIHDGIGTDDHRARVSFGHILCLG